MCYSVRTIFSTRYKGQLADFAQNFTDQKGELQFLITQKSAAAVTAMKGSLDSMTKKMDKLVQFLDKKSPDEQKVADMIASHGGEATVVGVRKTSWQSATDTHIFYCLVQDEKLLNSIASKLGEKMTSDIKQDMKFTLRSSLDEALQANQWVDHAHKNEVSSYRSTRAMYNLKFDAVQSQLEHAIQHSTEAILSRVRENGIMRLRSTYTLLLLAGFRAAWFDTRRRYSYYMERQASWLWILL
jgi:hypothetical protein